MAEHAAHLTSATDVDRPSVFEVVAQDSLMMTVRPAGKHAVRVLAETRPEQFGWLLRWYDEIYLFFDFIIQHHYLGQYSASFAENFYDLKRVPSGAGSTDPLSSKLKWRSLLFLVFVPYLKQKLDQMFEDLKYKEDTLPRSANAAMKVKIARAYLAFYPYVHMSWEGTSFMHMLAYTFNRNSWHSLPLRLSGTELRHRSESDDDRDAEMAWSDTESESWMNNLSGRALHGAGTALSSGLSVGVFFLQFLDWWYNSDASAPVLTALPTPTPPQRDSSETSAPHTCPVCGRLRTNETALSVSGYVFCFPCIHEYVRKHSCCPVTGYPAKMEHLIKIYQPDS
ncbi:peroxisome assembly protein 12-like [Littorina saxatilis]|uniref:Peroxisome assembly protein 12 n=1 Tax=Littorina saxatilis TaxID=31220 RepID=A0AAN9FXV3_9CAEN